MRRLSDDERARSASQPLHDAGSNPELRAQRERAARVVQTLRDYLRGELALADTQLAELELALERALLLDLRSRS